MFVNPEKLLKISILQLFSDFWEGITNRNRLAATKIVLEEA